MQARRARLTLGQFIVAGFAGLAVLLATLLSVFYEGSRRTILLASERLMAQANRIFGGCSIELIAGRASPFAHQRFVAPKRPQPIAGWGFSRGDPQVSQQISNRAASNERNAGCHRRPLHKMLMAIDEARRNYSPAKTHYMSTRTNARFKLVVASMRYNTTGADCDGVAFGMTKDTAVVQNQVSLFGSHPPAP